MKPAHYSVAEFDGYTVLTQTLIKPDGNLGEVTVMVFHPDEVAEVRTKLIESIRKRKISNRKKNQQ